MCIPLNLEHEPPFNLKDLPKEQAGTTATQYLYTPISLDTNISPLISHESSGSGGVYKELNLYLSENRLHDLDKFEFKVAHSTETVLLAVTEELHTAKMAKLDLVLILLDLSAYIDNQPSDSQGISHQTQNHWFCMAMDCIQP